MGEWESGCGGMSWGLFVVQGLFKVSGSLETSRLETVYFGRLTGHLKEARPKKKRAGAARRSADAIARGGWGEIRRIVVKGNSGQGVTPEGESP